MGLLTLGGKMRGLAPAGSTARKAISFGIVGAIGTALNTLLLYMLTAHAGLHYLLAAAIATEAAIILNFALNQAFTFRGEGTHLSLLARFLRFQLVSVASLAITLIVLWALVTALGERLLLAWNLVAILCAFAANFTLNRKYTWAQRPAARRDGARSALSGRALALLGIVLLCTAGIAHALPLGGMQLFAGEGKGQGKGLFKLALAEQGEEGGGDALFDLALGDEQNGTGNATGDGTGNATGNGTGNESEGNQTGGNGTGNGSQEPETATLVVRTTPVEAQVSLDGAPALDAAPSGEVRFDDLSAGEHTIIVTGDGYLDETRDVLLAAGDAREINITLTPEPATPANGSLALTTSPGGVDVGLDGTYVGTTDPSGALLLEDLAPGAHAVLLGKDGYEGQSKAIEILSGEQATLAVTLLAQNQTQGNGSIILSSSNVTDGHLFETETGQFSVTLGASEQITWTVDGETMRTTTAAQDTFEWSPGLLSTSGVMQALVTATTPTDSVSWTIAVEYVANPFFSSPDDGPDVFGAADTKIHVFTNDRAIVFSSLTAVLESTPDGSPVRKSYQLAPLPNPESEEVDWTGLVENADQGNSFLVGIEGVEQGTGNVVTFDFGRSRAHFRDYIDEQRSDRKEDDNRRLFGGRSGGGGGGGILEPKLVYALFEKDVVGVGEEQAVSADLSIGIGGEITRAEADILYPEGRVDTVELRLLRGTAAYGTWGATFESPRQGRHELLFIRAWEGDDPEPYELPADASFYSTSDEVLGDERLMLVYSTLESNVVKNGSAVLFRLDARDAQGITGVEAQVATSKGDRFSVPLTRVAGEPQYGTWEGRINATTPDTTVRIENVTLRNRDDSATYPLKARTFYVEALPPEQGNALTGNVAVPIWSREYLQRALKEPLVPTTVGFSIMLLTMALVLVNQRLRYRLEE